MNESYDGVYRTEILRIDVFIFDDDGEFFLDGQN